MIKIMERAVLSAEMSKELFYTDRAQGGRLYHLFNIGIYKVPIESTTVIALSITLPFFTIKFGYILMS